MKDPVLIGKGAAGCAFKPSKRCNGKEDAKYIAKLINKKNYYEEIEGAMIMKKIDPDGIFSMTIKETCSAKDADKPLIDSCPVLNKSDIKKIIYSDEGSSIRTLMCLDNEPDRAFRALLRILMNVIQGLQTMTQVGQVSDSIIANKEIPRAVHADIKPENIASKEGAENAKLIDFGLVTTRDMFFYNSVFLSPYRYWPPEWITLMWLCYKKNSTGSYPIQISESYIRDLSNNTSVIQLLSQPNREKLFNLMKSITPKEYMEAMNTILSYGKVNDAGVFTTYVGLSPEILLTMEESENTINFIQQAGDIDVIYDRIFNTWDVYGLGMTIYLLYRGTCRSLFVKEDGSDLPPTFVELLDGMMTYDFSNRFTPDVVVNMAEKIINEEPI
jgi:serine/threonine protein kinase